MVWQHNRTLSGPSQVIETTVEKVESVGRLPSTQKIPEDEAVLFHAQWLPTVRYSLEPGLR